MESGHSLGPAFADDLADAGLLDKPGFRITWAGDGHVTVTEATPGDLARLQDVIAAHDPGAPARRSMTLVPKIVLVDRFTDHELAAAQPVLASLDVRTALRWQTATQVDLADPQVREMVGIIVAAAAAAHPEAIPDPAARVAELLAAPPAPALPPMPMPMPQTGPFSALGRPAGLLPSI